MPGKPLKYRDLFRALRKYGIYLKSGGRHPHLVKGNPPEVSYPIPYHGKENDDIEGCYVRAIRRKFKLTPQDGVSDKDFYG